MTALWIVGILLAIFLVVQLSRVGVHLAFDEEFRVMLRLGPIRMQVVPKKETAKKKPKKDKATKKKKEKPKKEMPKITARAVLDSLPELWQILKKGLRMTFHRVRVAPMDISAVIGGDDRRTRRCSTAGSVRPCIRRCRCCRSWCICRTRISTWSRSCREGR